MELGELMQWTPHNINQTKTPLAPTTPAYDCEPHVYTKVFSNNVTLWSGSYSHDYQMSTPYVHGWIFSKSWISITQKYVMFRS